MKALTDQELLRDYAGNRSESAFAELVRRHIDLVYSAARRMVCDAHLAEDVTQGVFVALAQNAGHLTHHPVLSGWLHRTTQNLAANSVRASVRRQAREQEAAAMNNLHSSGTETIWEHLEPHLDAALGELSEADRDAVLLRYFDRKSAREMAQTLGTTEDAAQKRVNRAIERLRDVFAKQGVTVGAGGLAVALSANAVQAAPAGLALTISATAAGGATLATTATQAIVMTTMQKTLIGAVLAAAVGTGIYEAHQTSRLREQNQIFEQRQAPLTEQVQQLRQERDDATARLATLEQENERLRQTVAEVPRLRGEVTRLRALQQTSGQTKTAGVDMNAPFTQSVLALAERAGELNQYLTKMPDRRIPELDLLTESDWLEVASDAKFDTETDVRKALSRLRRKAKDRLRMGTALGNFARANHGQLPTDLFQLKPFLKSAIGETAPDDATLDAILERYKLLHTGNLSDFDPDAWFIAEKAPVDKDHDSRAKFGNYRSSIIGTGVDTSGDPDDPSY